MANLAIFVGVLAVTGMICTIQGASVVSVKNEVPVNMRLIQFAEGNTTWMTTADIDRLASLPGQRKNFFDVTDHVNSPRRDLKTSTGAIPSEPIRQEIVEGYLNNLDDTGALRTITKLSSYFTRYYTTTTSKDAVLWLMDQYREASGDRTDVTIELFEHSWVQPSLIVRILGKDSEHSDETVVLGGHIDSTAGGATAQAPGADDDASGSASVLEVFRTLMESRFEPERTIEFHAYAAEEVGLRGSQAVAEEYAALKRNVVSMVQFDMVGYPADTTTPVGITSDYVDPVLSAFVGKLFATYSRLPTEPSICGYACSDHASWFQINAPSSFPFECKFGNHNPAIHTANDVVSRLSQDRINEFIKMGVGYIVEMGLLPPQ